MAAYCTIEELAQALRITVDADNRTALQSCVDAAAEQIDAYLDRDTDDPLPTPTPAVVNRDNVFRAVQWYKANDVALGGGGTTETGILVAPSEAWAPQSAAIYKTNWGIA